MLSTHQRDSRQRLLGMAFDFPSSPYAVGDLVIRPYSINAHRRAEMLGLVTVAAGMEAAREHLSPVRFLSELDALHWLLTAPLATVQTAYRAGLDVVRGHLRRSTLPPTSLASFAAEIDRILCVSREALFDVVERESAREVTDEPPPESHLPPCVLTSLVLSLAEALHVTDEHVLEFLPFPRAMEYLHVLQNRNPLLWTVSPRADTPDLYGEEVAQDEGYGEEISF